MMYRELKKRIPEVLEKEEIPQFNKWDVERYKVPAKEGMLVGIMRPTSAEQRVLIGHNIGISTEIVSGEGC